MGKVKTYPIHSVKKFPKDIESLFDKFAEHLSLCLINVVRGGPEYWSFIENF